MFHITVSEPENIAYLIDLYAFKNVDDDTPNHIGYHFLLPNMLKNSEGVLELPITCASKHRHNILGKNFDLKFNFLHFLTFLFLGMMKIEFVKITPLNNPKCDMKVNFKRTFKIKF